MDAEIKRESWRHAAALHTHPVFPANKLVVHVQDHSQQEDNVQGAMEYMEKSLYVN